MDMENDKDSLLDDAIGRKILDAAISIINEEGFENLTIRKVAKESGCSNSAIYMRFIDKDTLGNAAAALLAKPLLQVIENSYIQSDSFIDNVQRISKAILTEVYQMDLGAVLMQLKYRGELLRQNNSPFVMCFESYIKEASLNGDIQVSNARLLASTYETSFWGVAYMCRLNKDMSLERALEILEFHNQIMYEGIRKRTQNDDLWDELRKKGVDVDKALERMKGNKDAYRSFLIEFFEDPDFEMLGQSIENDDAEEAFEYAHGLKGMAANLGLDEIYSNICVLVEILRQRTTEGASTAYELVLQSCDIIKKLLNK